jgi:hypothetical protein
MAVIFFVLVFFLFFFLLFPPPPLFPLLFVSLLSVKIALLATLQI